MCVRTDCFRWEGQLFTQCLYYIKVQTLKPPSSHFCVRMAQICVIVQLIIVDAFTLHLLVFINSFVINIFFLNNCSTMWIRSFHLPQISDIYRFTYNIYICIGGMYTRPVCFPVGLKLTHLATASSVMRGVNRFIGNSIDKNRTRRNLQDVLLINA